MSKNRGHLGFRAHSLFSFYHCIEQTVTRIGNEYGEQRNIIDDDSFFFPQNNGKSLTITGKSYTCNNGSQSGNATKNAEQRTDHHPPSTRNKHSKKRTTLLGPPTPQQFNSTPRSKTDRYISVHTHAGGILTAETELDKDEVR